MRKSIILSLVAFAAAVVPMAAHASGTSFSGVVVAKEAKRGTVVVANRTGSAMTVHARLSAARIGDRISVAGTRLRDGTFRATTMRVTGRAARATVRGVVVRRLSTKTLVSTGHSVIAIRRHAAARALASRGLAPGSIAKFGVTISGGVVSEVSATTLGTTNTVQVDGRVVTLTPFVVNVEGLPITIGLGTATLPSTLASGDEVELTVTVDANNVFTLVSVDESQAGEQGDDNGHDNSNADNQPAQGQEVEVEGTVFSSSASQVVVTDGSGKQTTFVAAVGVVLPVLAQGTRVEAKGILANGVVTLRKLEVKGQDDESASGGSDDDGGSSGSGSFGGSGSGGGDSGGGGDD